MNVIVVEDDEMTRRYIQMILNEYGYSVSAASDGREAITLIENSTVSVVITDWMMPNMDGLELIEEIRRREFGNYIYIIMMTIRGEKEVLIKAMETGADAFITKPVDPDELGVSLKAAKRVIDLESTLSARNTQLEEAYSTIKADVVAAGKIQQSLLPSKAPEVEGVAVDWLFKPHSELGGDIFDIISLDKSLLAMYMIDVAGKGVEAALLAVTLSRMLSPFSDDIMPIRGMRELPRNDDMRSPSEIANLLNMRFYDGGRNHQFFTLLYAAFDTANMTFTYTAAGHRGAIFSGAQTYGFTEPTFPICFTDNPGYRDYIIQLSAGDRLLFFTDGLYECAKKSGEQFGITRMAKIVKSLRSENLRTILNTLHEEVKVWCAPDPIDDDVSALAIEAL